MRYVSMNYVFGERYVYDVRKSAHRPSILLTDFPLSLLSSSQQGRKQRKHVDRRASKGRKIRYHVHEKLVNFMTPVELKAPQYASNLFANLFGGGGK